MLPIGLNALSLGIVLVQIGALDTKRKSMPIAQYRIRSISQLQLLGQFLIWHVIYEKQ